MTAGKLAERTDLEPLAATSVREVGGDVAAQVFARLDGGAHPRDIVTELVVAPDTVEYLWRTWARLRGRVIVSPETLCALAAALHRPRVPETAAELVQLVELLGSEEQGPCSRCGRDVAQYCYACPGRAAAKAQAEGRRRRGGKSRE
jgi:hypothetical protein